MHKIWISMSMTIVVLVQTAAGTTHLVDVVGGGDYSSIREGIAAAATGDTVLVAPGTYTGTDNRNLDFGGVNLVLISEAGIGSTIIDCQGEDRAFSFNDTGVDTTSVIRGFTIANGYTDNYNGGGIRVNGDGLVIEDCLIRDCTASHNGGGLYVGYSLQGVHVRNCVLQDNTATYRGGGAMVDHTAASFQRCLFVGNSTTDDSEVFYGGGGLHCNWAVYTSGYICIVTRCTFVANSSGGNGSGIYGAQSISGLWVMRCIIAFNIGPGLGFDGEPIVENFTSSCVFGNEGGDAIPGYSTLLWEDPRFCGLEARDFTLCANSVCLPANNPGDFLIGFAAEGCGDCIASPVEPKSLSGIKELFR